MIEPANCAAKVIRGGIFVYWPSLRSWSIASVWYAVLFPYKLTYMTALSYRWCECQESLSLTARDNVHRLPWMHEGRQDMHRVFDLYLESGGRGDLDVD